MTLSEACTLLAEQVRATSAARRAAAAWRLIALAALVLYFDARRKRAPRDPDEEIPRD